MVNWSEWTGHLVEKGMGPYETVLGVSAWVLIFSAIIGYVYIKQQSYIAAAMASLVLLTAFISTGYITGVDSWVLLIVVLSSLAVTGLIILFISKRRN